MKNKICLICHTAIDVEKEFCKFEHLKNLKEIKSKAYYHVECFGRRLNGSAVQEKLAKEGFNLIRFAKEKMGIDDVETQEVTI